jgi:hypothetical protein
VRPNPLPVSGLCAHRVGKCAAVAESWVGHVSAISIS